MPHRLYQHDIPSNKRTKFFMLLAFFNGELVGVSKHKIGSGGNADELNSSYAKLIKKHCDKVGEKVRMTLAHFQTTSVREDENGDHYFLKWTGSSTGYVKTLVQDKTGSSFFSRYFSLSKR